MQKNLKKLGITLIIATFVITFIIVLILIAKKSKDQGPITIVYWGLWEPKEVYQPLIDEYEKTHPNIKIQYIQKSFGHTNPSYVYTGTYKTAVLERLTKTGGVDIMRVHASWMPQLLPYISPAPSQKLDATYIKSNYYPAIVESTTTTSGKVLAMPLYIDGLVLFYNKDLFKQAGIANPPTTWDEVINYSNMLTKKDAQGNIIQSGIALGTGSNITHSPEIVLLMLTQSNVNVIDLKSQKFTFNNEEGKMTFKSYANFANYEKVWSYRLGNDLSMFVQGKLAMMIAPSWRAFDIMAQNSKINFGIAPVPVLAGANPNTPQYLSNFYVEVVPKNSKHAQEAWEFLYWLGQPEQLRKLYQNEMTIAGRPFGEVYPRKDMANELKDMPYVSAIIQMAPSMKSWPIYDLGTWEQVIKKTLINIETNPNSVDREVDNAANNLNNLIFTK